MTNDEQSMLTDERPELALSAAEGTDDGRLPEGWQRMRLGELGTVSGGSTPSTKISEYWDGDIAWATPSDVTRCTNIYITGTARKITQAGLLNSTTKLLPAGSVLMTSRATIGEVVINNVPMATNQGLLMSFAIPKLFLMNIWLSGYNRISARLKIERMVSRSEKYLSLVSKIYL